VNKSRSAFTMIEIMVVIFLVGILATIVFPRAMRKEPQADWKTILEDMNNLVFFARQEAIANQRMYRLAFHSVTTGPDFVIVEEERQDPEKPKQKIYVPATSYYFTPRYVFHPAIKIKAFFRGKKDVLEDQKGRGYCHVISDGLVEDALIHMTRKIDNEETGGTFKMMPFFGKFEFFDGYQKPGR